MQDVMNQSPARADMERALTCLYLEAPASVCEDVGAKVRNREAELQAALSRSLSEAESLRAALVGMNIALVRDENPEAAIRIVAAVRAELLF